MATATEKGISKRLAEAVFALTSWNEAGIQVASEGCLSAFLKDEREQDGPRNHNDFSYDKFLDFAKPRFNASRGGLIVWTACLPEGVMVTFYSQSSWDDMVERLLHVSGDFLPVVTFTPGGHRREGDDILLEERPGLYFFLPNFDHLSTDYPYEAPSQAEVAAGTPAQALQPVSGLRENWQTPEIIHRLNTAPEIRVARDEFIVERLLSLIDPSYQFQLMQPVQLKKAEEPPAKEGEEETPEENEDDKSLNGSVMQQLYKTNTLPPGLLDQASTFFGVKPEEFKEGIQLQGTRTRLYPSQAAFVFQYVLRCTRHPDRPLDGQILADQTGSGKTISAFGLFATMRLMILSERHWKRHPKLHNINNSGGTRCLAGNPYGIQCPCVLGSLSREYLEKLIKGPSVFLVPASSREQWVNKAGEYFLPTIKAKATDSTRRGRNEDEVPFILSLVYNERGHKVTPLDGEPAYSLSRELRAQLLGTPDITFEQEPKEAWTVDKFDTTKKKRNKAKRYADLQEVGYDIHFDGPINEVDDPSRFLCIYSVESFRLLSGVGEALGMGYKIDIYPSKSKTVKMRDIEIMVPWSIRPNLVVYDEFHNVKNAASNTWKCLRDILTSQCRDGRTIQWCFLSATPLAAGPKDILPICDVIYNLLKDRRDASKEMDDLKSEFQYALKQKETEDSDHVTLATLAQKIVDATEHLFIARYPGLSPLLDGVVPDSGLQRVDAGNDHEIEIGVPRGAIDAVEAIKDKIRIRQKDAKLKLNENRLEQDQAFNQLYNAAIMPGIALAIQQHGPGYPSRAAEITKDLENESTSLIFNYVNLHEGHRWKDLVAQFILKAYEDRGNGNSERRKHVLIVTQTPCLAGHMYAVLRKEKRLEGRVEVHHITQKTTQTAGKRFNYISTISKSALEDEAHTHIVISTAQLIGEGIDTLTFCSYLIIYGQLWKPNHEDQVPGRLLRIGQSFPVHKLTIISKHNTHTVMRDRARNNKVIVSSIIGDERQDLIDE